jgi:transcriptional regulator with XRE-family HTH domain
MTRKSFGEDSFTQSVTLQNVSANLDLIRRLEHLSLAELGKRTGLSDRHLDSLIRMRSNVTVLVLEQIAESLGIPFLTFIGTRLDANIPGGRSGFLDGLRDENAFPSVDERRQSPSAVHLETATQQRLPSGLTPDLTNLLQQLIAKQDLMAQEQTNLSRRVEELSKMIGEGHEAKEKSPRQHLRSEAKEAGSDLDFTVSAQRNSGSAKAFASTELKKRRNKTTSRHEPELGRPSRRTTRKRSSAK